MAAVGAKKPSTSSKDTTDECPIGSSPSTDPQQKLQECHEYQEQAPYNWLEDFIGGGSLPRVDLDTGTMGWASPPANVFNLRSESYFSSRKKSPSGDCLLRPAGVDWLWSTARLDNILARPDNRISSTLQRAHALGLALESFVFAVNLQIPSGTCKSLSAVFYFVADKAISRGSLLDRFVNGDDSFRDSRFKLVNRILKGPWIVQKMVGKHSACLIRKKVKCTYHRGVNYLEIDVDIGSSDIANTLTHLALGFVTEVRMDIGFLVEAQDEEELPERLLGAVRMSHIDKKSAQYVEPQG